MSGLSRRSFFLATAALAALGSLIPLDRARAWVARREGESYDDFVWRCTNVEHGKVDPTDDRNHWMSSSDTDNDRACKATRGKDFYWSEHDQECSDLYCFFTTACCSAIGLADNCFELTMLRRFRDVWLARQPGGPAAIARYYERAPIVLAAMSARGEQGRLPGYYASHILPAALTARFSLFPLTNRIYNDLIWRLERRYGRGSDETH